MVVGGYGFFGSRLVRRLALQAPLHVVVAGRSGLAAQALVDALLPDALAGLSAVALDAMDAGLEAVLRQQEIDLLIHASGPFQGQDHRVARACAQAGVHYADLADGRDFVCGIAALQPEALARGVLLASGASSVPALSTAAADRLAAGMERVEAIDIGISPGNRTERGLSTVAAILSYCGKRLAGPGPAPVFGWLGAWRHRYPAPVGPRLLSPCDVPDLALLAPRYAGSPRVRFGAGLELAFLHRGMNAMAWLARLGLVRDWSVHAAGLKRMADWFRAWGSDAGAMHVRVRGRDGQGAVRERTWVLVAGSGDGPYVPTLAASALARRLAAGQLPATGAMPCMGLLTLEDFQQEAQGLDIRMMEVQP
jgi:hypothetical protein